MKKLSLLILVIACSLPSFSKDVPNLIPFRKGDRWGYCDRSKNIVIECRYDYARPFHNSRAAVKLNGFFFFINPNGKRVSQFYEEVEDFQNGCNIARVKKGELWGMIDFYGREDILPKYLYIRKFNNGVAWAVDSMTRKWGLVNEKGEVLTPFIYDYINDFNERQTIAGIYKDGDTQYYLLNTRGTDLLNLDYSFVDNICDGLAVVRRDSTFGYIGRRNDKTKIDLKFKNALCFSEKKAMVVLFNDDRIIINKKGRQLFILNFIVSYEAIFSSGRMAVYKDSLWGYIDTKNNLSVNFLYTKCTSYNNGIASVKSAHTGKWGFIDVNNVALTEFKYDENLQDNYWTLNDVGYSFEGSLCLVSMNGRLGYINERGVEFWED